jgi:hypothetical protein
MGWPGHAGAKHGTHLLFGDDLRESLPARQVR